MERRKIGWGLLEIVVADDPLRRAVSRHLSGDVVLEVDIVGSLHNCRPQHELACRLRVRPAATIDSSAACRTQGAGPLPEQTANLNGSLEVIQPQFDQPDTVAGQMRMLGHHMPMPAPSDTDTDHAEILAGLGATCDETAGRAPAVTTRGKSVVRGGSGAIHEPDADREQAHRLPLARADRPP